MLSAWICLIMLLICYTGLLRIPLGWITGQGRQAILANRGLAKISLQFYLMILEKLLQPTLLILRSMKVLGPHLYKMKLPRKILILLSMILKGTSTSKSLVIITNMAISPKGYYCFQFLMCLGR